MQLLFLLPTLLHKREQCCGLDFGELHPTAREYSFTPLMLSKYPQPE